MPIEFVGIIALILGGLALRLGPAFAMRTFLPSTLFGSAAAVILPGIGSIQPAHLMLGFMSVVVFLDRTNVHRACRCLRFPEPGFWLLVTWLYGTLAAIFIPRILAGQLLVNAIGVDMAAFTQVPLAPSSGNITQPVYFAADLVCFLACSAYAETLAGFRTIATTMLAYCVANIVLALLDLATFWTGTAYLLDFIRNATYVIYTDTVVVNMKRIIGSFTEASSFANATIGALGYSLQLGLKAHAPALCFTIAFASLILLLFSTSSTAYVALPLCLGLIAASAIWSAMRAKAVPPTVAFLIFVPLIGAAMTIVLFMYRPALDGVRDFLDAMVFTKSGTSSGIERARFNQEGLISFLDTGGIGAGIGSVRTSSFVVAVLSNLGVVGGLSYALFLTTTLVGRGPPSSSSFPTAVRAAARMACVSLLISATISGALIDLGLPFFIFAALANAKPDALAATSPWRRPARGPLLTSNAITQASQRPRTLGRPRLLHLR